MSKYKIGDRVIIEESNIEYVTKFADKIGVVVETDDNPPYDCRVKTEGTRAGVWCKVRCLANERLVITHDGKTTTATLYKGNEKISAEAKCAPEDTFDFMFGAKLAMERLFEKTKEVVVNGFKVGDRVNVDGHNGTVICINNLACLGIEFDTHEPICGHDCGGNELLSGKTGTYGKCSWYSAYRNVVNHGEVRELYNGKVVCVETGPNHCYTVGKIYQFTEGVLTADDGFEMNNYGNKYHSFKEWSEFTSGKFIEVVE